MGNIHLPPSAMLVLAAFSRYDEALDWARDQAERHWGPALASERFEFTETDYYEPTMGPGLRKQFLAFERPMDPASLVDWKIETNAWEEQYARQASHPELRPLNLDPGYLTLAKLVLASTKDHAHRIYLGRGIYAEVTLIYQHGRWLPREWTFPDYRRGDYHEFFDRCRKQMNKK
jgi:hypothetical protein